MQIKLLLQTLSLLCFLVSTIKNGNLEFFLFQKYIFFWSHQTQFVWVLVNSFFFLHLTSTSLVYSHSFEINFIVWLYSTCGNWGIRFSFWPINFGLKLQFHLKSYMQTKIRIETLITDHKTGKRPKDFRTLKLTWKSLEVKGVKQLRAISEIFSISCITPKTIKIKIWTVFFQQIQNPKEKKNYHT